MSAILEADAVPAPTGTAEDPSLFGKPYLGDPRIDRLMGIIIALAGEVAVLKAQVMRAGIGPGTSEEAIHAELGAFAREVFKPIADPDFDLD